MSPGDTFRRLPAEKQERILTIALDEFSRKGYQGTSINVIVQRLAIAKGSIFQYFGDKQGLLRAVFEWAIETVKEELREVRDAPRERDLFERLEQTLLAGVRFINRRPKIYALYLHMLYESHFPLRREFLRTLRQYSLAYMQKLLVGAQARGEVRANLNFARVAFMLDALMDRFLQAQTISHLDAGLGLYRIDEAEAQEWIVDIVAFVRRAIGT